MTMRSKQWYTITSKLSNSFANNSIGRLPGSCVATRSSVKRPVESTAPGCQESREREERDSKGKETVGCVPFGTVRHWCGTPNYTANRRQHDCSRTVPRLPNPRFFKISNMFG